MEKTFQAGNVNINLIHDRLLAELQNNGFEVHKDEPRENGFKVFVRRDGEHGEVELFDDWGTLRLITRGRLEWELMSIAEPIVASSLGQAGFQQFPQQQGFGPQQVPQQFPQQYPQQFQAQRPFQQQPQFGPQQPPLVFQPQPFQGLGPEHSQLLNVLIQNGYQIVVNYSSGQTFFIRGRKGNYVIDIEGRPQP